MNCKKKCQEFMDSVGLELETKGDQKPGITEEELLDFPEYLFSQLMKESVSFHVIEEFKLKKATVSSHQFFKLAYTLPESKSKILNCKIKNQRNDDPFKQNCRNTMKMFVKAITNIKEFVKNVIFDTDNDESLIVKIFAEENKKLQKGLEKKIKEMRNFDHAENIALGCRATCYFSGARCEQNETCKGTKKHKAKFHRPMVFHGTHWLKNGKKELIDVVTSSQDNLQNGKWPMPTTNAAG